MVACDSPWSAAGGAWTGTEVGAELPYCGLWLNEQVLGDCCCYCFFSTLRQSVLSLLLLLACWEEIEG